MADAQNSSACWRVLLSGALPRGYARLHASESEAESESGASCRVPPPTNASSALSGQHRALALALLCAMARAQCRRVTSDIRPGLRGTALCRRRAPRTPWGCCVPVHGVVRSMPLAEVDAGGALGSLSFRYALRGACVIRNGDGNVERVGWPCEVPF